MLFLVIKKSCISAAPILATFTTIVTDFYSSQMLGGVTDMSYGLLSLVPKFKDGTPIERYEDAVIKVDGKELKAWTAIAQYMQSFADTDGDGVPNVPQTYATKEGRKVVEDSKDIKDLIKNPNKFTYIIGAVLVVLLVLVGLLVMWFRKISRKYGIITKVRELKNVFRKVKNLSEDIKK